MRSKHVLIKPDFFPKAKALRQEFEARFQNPKQTTHDRFVWDYWYVKDQYTLIRSLAENIFTEKNLASFTQNLTKFGQENLGCGSITPPWVSYYIDGCEQQFHADVPHGPWAYVYSLTPWKTRKFRGGETILLKPETLDYWSHFEQMNGIEMNDLTTKIPANFNQLLVFDPRIPHGVVPVHGVQDPMEARVVIHGWFTHPQPILHGALANAKTQKLINDVILSMEPIYARYTDVAGNLTVCFDISAGGRVQALNFLSNTLVSTERAAIAPLLKEMNSHIENIIFPKAKGKTSVTIPFLFQSS